MMKNLYEKFFEIDYFVVAHRGASGIAPENTLSSFEKAIHSGAHFIELDVRLTKDYIPIVLHDRHLERTTNGFGSISNYTFEEIRNFDSGSWFSEKFSGEKIPSLEEVINFVKNKIYLNIELKTLDKNYQSAIDQIIETLEKNNYTDKTVFTSFHYKYLDYIRKVKPKIPIGVIKIPDDERLPSKICKDLGSQIYICEINELNEQIANDAHKNEIFLGIYSVDTEEQLEFVFNFKPKAIVTNFPDNIIKILKEKYLAKI